MDSIAGHNSVRHRSGFLIGEKMSRRRATVKESEKPCYICDHRPTTRHHLLEYAKYGENECTVQLCDNCHRLYHLVSRAYENGDRDFPGRTKAARLVNLAAKDMTNKSTVNSIVCLFNLTKRFKKMLNEYDIGQNDRNINDAIKLLRDIGWTVISPNNILRYRLSEQFVNSRIIAREVLGILASIINDESLIEIRRHAASLIDYIEQNEI